MAIEIVDLPIEHGGSFHSYVAIYQRVNSADNIPQLNWVHDPISF